MSPGFVVNFVFVLCFYMIAHPYPCRIRSSTAFYCIAIVFVFKVFFNVMGKLLV